MDHKISKLLGKPTLEGQVGESHVWDGPLDTTGFPMGSGSSSVSYTHLTLPTTPYV